MKTKIYNVKLVLLDKIIDDSEIIIDNGKISSFGKISDLVCDIMIDGKSSYVSPGFVDIHIHGGGGYDFMDGTLEAYEVITNTHLKHGTTSMVPTTLASSKEELLKVVEVYKNAKKDKLINCNLLGLHLEGPYISKNQAGAQSLEFIRDPNPLEYKEIIKEANNSIIRWSIAPELNGSLEMGKYLKENNILASIAHSDATDKEVKVAIENGFTHVTHLYSAMSTIKRVNGFRVSGVLESSYLNDELTVEVIADGCHLPYSLLQYVYKFKGSESTCLITDAMRASGSDVKTSYLGSKENGIPVVIEDGVAKMLDHQAFAGSIATCDRLVRTMVDCGISLVETIKMMTYTPIKITNKDLKKGQIKIGYDADLVMFDENINISLVMVNGKIINFEV